MSAGLSHQHFISAHYRHRAVCTTWTRWHSVAVYGPKTCQLPVE